MHIKQLIGTFKKYPLDTLARYQNILSTRTDAGELLSPYIPFIGKFYEKYKVLMYATSQSPKPNSLYLQNLRKNAEYATERLYFSEDFERQYPKDRFSFADVAIRPYRDGILPALLNIFLRTHFANFNSKCLNETQDFISVTNYYKFSLYKNKDVNPNNMDSMDDYLELNDTLVEMEIKYIKPKYVLTFGGRQEIMLRKLSNKYFFELIKINDPAWVLRGGSGCFNTGGSWYERAKNITDTGILYLINAWAEDMVGLYKHKKEAMEIYLKKYYLDWR